MDRAEVSLGKDVLFSRLAAGLSSRLTVLTPNRRLAQALHREFADFQAARGVSVWETPDILPFPAFAKRLWEDALHSELGARLPLLLSDAQEQALWHECIEASGLGKGLMSVPAAAAQCREAWRLAHAWRLHGELSRVEGHEDAKTFLEWSARYERASGARGCTDAARLPDVVKSSLREAAVRLPASVVAFGFDLVTPQQRAFFDALARAGVAVAAARAAPRASKALRVAFPSVKEEIAHCARWARARVEGGSTRIGIVVPDLARLRSAIVRALTDAMDPGHRLPGATRGALPFDISLGLALERYPIVHEALALLGLCGREVEFEAVSRLLRSPFLAGAEAEAALRARLDAEIRKRATVRISIEGLRRVLDLPGVPRAPLLEALIARLADLRKKSLFRPQSPSSWAQGFTEALRMAGFPGERPLDSAEYQTWAKWHQVLAEFATLDRVVEKLAFRDAIGRLCDLARDTLFQPQGAEAPVQVMGILESAGLEFDHLWVMGLTDEAWPLTERAHPFIPLRLQRKAGVPQADPAASLEVDRAFTAGWLGAAAEVIVSHATAESDRDLFASPLIRDVPAGCVEELALPAREALRDAIRRAGKLERFEDDRAPPVEIAARRGGTSLFKDQSACPFRGFAVHRLQARPLEAPQPAIDARERGQLLHAVLATVWSELRDKAGLECADEAELRALLQRAADGAIASIRERRPDALRGRLGEIERERLVSHVAQWLAFERRRDPFEVVATERKIPLAFGGVEVQARIDRVDRLPNGAHAVIDYKTGEARVAAWFGERTEDPQLPMYALGGAEEIAAIAFARVKAGKFRFEGLARSKGLLPGLDTVEKNRANQRREKPYATWAELEAAWRVALEGIGAGFAAGDARIAPHRGRITCEQCHQRTFCRVSEALAASTEEGNGNGE